MHSLVEPTGALGAAATAACRVNMAPRAGTASCTCGAEGGELLGQLLAAARGAMQLRRGGDEQFALVSAGFTCVFVKRHTRDGFHPNLTLSVPQCKPDCYLFPGNEGWQKEMFPIERMESACILISEI